MGRPRKNGSAESGEQAPAPAGHNGIDPDKVQSFVQRLENLYADIRSIMMKALSQCKSVHEDIKEVYQEAKDEAGIPKKALKTVIKVRALARKAEEAREALEPEMQETFDQVRHALGDLADTPLGEATTRRTFGEQIRDPGAPLDPARSP